MDSKKGTKIVLLCNNLSGVGGAEKLLFEEAKYLEKKGNIVHILTFNYKEEVLFNNTYQFNIEQVGKRTKSQSIISKSLQEIKNMHALRGKIQEIKPDKILAASSWDCVPLYFSTLFTKFTYSTHIHGTIIWFQEDLLKYALIHRKVFNEIRESVIGHKQFVPEKPHKVSITRRILNEIYAYMMYLGIRKAQKIFVLSKQMQWEVKKLYKKDAIIVKGAFSPEFLFYEQKKNIKETLKIENKTMILNLNRLDPRKRVDLLINAFKIISNEYSESILVIGGVGPEEKNLKKLTKELKLENRVKFVGYVTEEDKWEYIASCDLFVHPNWADFAIAAYEALALQKKVIWSTEMEIDDILKGNKHIFPTDPTIKDLSETMRKALTTQVTEENDLSEYAWDKYCDKVINEIEI